MVDGAEIDEGGGNGGQMDGGAHFGAAEDEAVAPRGENLKKRGAGVEGFNQRALDCNLWY